MPQVVGIEKGNEWAGGGIQSLQHRYHLSAVLPARNRAESMIAESFKHLLNAAITAVTGAVIEHHALEIPVALRRNRIERRFDIGSLIVAADHDRNARQPDAGDPRKRGIRLCTLSGGAVRSRAHISVVPGPLHR